jgi:CO/xanthine dehydrogenase Mo-binding subunit
VCSLLTCGGGGGGAVVLYAKAVAAAFIVLFGAKVVRWEHERKKKKIRKEGKGDAMWHDVQLTMCPAGPCTGGRIIVAVAVAAAIGIHCWC